MLDRSSELLSDKGPASTVSRTGLRSRWNRFALSLGTLVTVLLLVEIGFRGYDCCFQGLPFFWDPAVASKKTTELYNPLLLFRGPWQDWHGRIKTAEQIVEPKGRKVLRIVCLGGSTTQDMTAFGEGRITYPTELQISLNARLGDHCKVVVETINAGFAAHSTMHMLVLLETELLSLRPDVLIVYENINDLIVNYFPGPTAPVYANKFRDPFYIPPEMTVAKTTFCDHSRLLTWGRDRVKANAWYNVRYTDSPKPLAHADTFRNNLCNIHAIAQRHGMVVVFGLQAFAPDQQLFENHFHSKPYNDAIYYPRIEVLHQHFQAYNRIVREMAAECSCACADPYGALLGQNELFADAIHLHAEGARRVGRVFARTLIDAGFDNWVRAKQSGAERHG